MTETNLRNPTGFKAAYFHSFRSTLPTMLLLGAGFILMGGAVPEIFYVLYIASAAISLMAFIGLKEAWTFKERVAAWLGAGVIPTTAFITTAIAQSLT